MWKWLDSRILKPGLILSLLLGLVATPLTGVMIKLSLFRLVRDSDLIVQGVVKEIQSSWSLDKEIILTVATIEIEEVFNGDSLAGQILVQYPGGTVGSLSLRVSDMPVLEAEDSVFLFLKRIADPSAGVNSYGVALNVLPAFQVFGQAQGVYHIDQSGIASKQGYALAAVREEPDVSMPVSMLREKIDRILRFLREDNAKQKKRPAQ